jgi:hypothetical protein
MSSKATANESMLEIAVNAAAAKHDLTGFRRVNAAEGLPDGYEAKCRKCGRIAWVGDDGLVHNLLDHRCRG